MPATHCTLNYLHIKFTEIMRNGYMDMMSLEFCFFSCIDLFYFQRHIRSLGFLSLNTGLFFSGLHTFHASKLDIGYLHHTLYANLMDTIVIEAQFFSVDSMSLYRGLNILYSRS